VVHSEADDGMSLEGDIRTALLNMSAVTALVGTDDDALIRPYMLDDRDNKEAAHIIVEVDQDRPQNDLTGVGGLTYSDVNISCRATSPGDARSLADAVKRNGTSPGTGLAGYSGTFDAVLESETPTITRRGDNSQRSWFSVELSFVMSQTEAV